MITTEGLEMLADGRSAKPRWCLNTPSTQYCRAALTSEQTARQGLQQLSLRIGDTQAAWLIHPVCRALPTPLSSN